MDQGPLITEQMDAGAELIHEFDKYAPLQAAFWFKGNEDGRWFLYLISDRINDSNFGAAYGEIHRIVGPRPNLWLDPFQVKVAGVEDPMAKDVMDIQRKYPDRLPMRLRDRFLGGRSVGEVFIYALPIPASTP